MSRLWSHHVWIVLAAVAVFFTNLGSAGLFDEDEPKNAACAREMLAHGDWVVPSFNEELRTDKPVLLYWLMMPAYYLFGVSEFGARFASALLAVGTVVATYHLGRLLFRAEAGLWGALAMASALSFGVVARAATPDSTLIFCTTLALLAYVWSVSRRAENAWQTGESLPLDRPSELRVTGEELKNIINRFSPHSWLGALMIYAAMALGVLAKGPVAVLLPTASIGMFLLIVSSPWSRPDGPAFDWFTRAILWLRRVLRPFSPRRLLAATLALRPLTAILVVAAIALPWYVLVGLRTDGAWLAGFFGKHNIERFVAPLENHDGTIFYYLIVIAIGFFPWSIFFNLTTVHVAGRLRSRHPWRASYLLLLCWLGMYLVFFSLARTKLPNYILPAYPALALLTGAFFDQWITEPSAISRRLVQLALATLGLVGVGLIIGLPIAAHFLLPGEAWLGTLGLVPLVGALLAYWAYSHGAIVRTAATIGLTCTLLACGAFGFAATRVARQQNSPALVSIARLRSTGQPRIAAFDCFSPSLVFYAESRVTPLGLPEDVASFFANSTDSFLVARTESLPLLEDALPPGVVVLTRQPRFLRHGELVLLGRSGTKLAQFSDRPHTVDKVNKR